MYPFVLIACTVYEDSFFDAVLGVLVWVHTTAQKTGGIRGRAAFNGIL